ncbi:unnamed protein product, partial [Chrysoparadoxa australica]
MAASLKATATSLRATATSLRATATATACTAVISLRGLLTRRLIPPAALLYLLLWLRTAQRPKVFHAQTERNKVLLGLLQHFLGQRYWPSLLCVNGHAHTCLGYIKRGPRQSLTREIVRTWDGGNFALDWRDIGAHEADLNPGTPTLLLVHGLNGHSEEAYVLYMMEVARQAGWRAVAFNHRGCGGTKLTSPWGYCGAFTGDLRMAVNQIKRRYPESPVLAAGYSLGANLLVKYLGEEGAHGSTPLAAAVSVSNPWDFARNPIGAIHAPPGTPRLSIWESLVSKVYGFALTTGLKQYVREHRDAPALRKKHKLFDLDGVLSCNGMREFDDMITVPMWGYDNVNHYHQDASSYRYLDQVKAPLLCLNAEDDPICPARLWPEEKAKANPHVVFVGTKAGGHLGWCVGFNPLCRAAWTDQLMMDYFKAVLSSAGTSSSSAAR